MWEASSFSLALIHHLTICDQFCISLRRIHGSTIVYKAVKPPSTILFLFSNQRICPLQEPHACLGSHCLYCSATGQHLDGFPWMPGSTSTAWLWFPPRCRTTSAYGGSPPISVGGGRRCVPAHRELLKLQAVFLVLRHFLSLIRGRCAGENQRLHRYSVHHQAGQLTVCCEFQTSKHLNFIISSISLS